MKTLKDINVKDKRVLVRVDFNVPIEDGQVMDDFRIRASLPTIKYLQEKRAKTVLLAHLGRPEGRDPAYSLSPVVRCLEEILRTKVNPVRKSETLNLGALSKNKELPYSSRLPQRVRLSNGVNFVDDCIGERVKNEINKLNKGDVILLENLRFYPEEEANDEAFAKKLASLGDIYLNDAFGVSHRAHASVEAITRFLPSAAGLLLEKEIQELSRVKKNPRHPLVMIMGGAKVATKLKLIVNFLNKVDHIIIGGILANSILAFKGLNIGKSIVAQEEVKRWVDGLDLTNTKLHLPLDVVSSRDFTGKNDIKISAAGKVDPDYMILDIGPDSVFEFSSIIKEAKEIIWNGPMGFSEVKSFAKGTEGLALALLKSNAYKVVGGGDVIALLDKMEILDKIDYVSTGGGAMLEFLAGEELPGIRALEKQRGYILAL